MVAHVAKEESRTIVGLELDKDDKSFKYLFFALGAAVRGWNYMCKVVAIDATFLTGQYKGTLVVATAQDDGLDVVVIFDRHRSIIKAVSEVYKEAGHGFCARHIAQNLKVKVNKGMGRKSSRGDTVAERYPKVAEYMQKEELDPEKWARYRVEAGCANDSEKMTPHVDKVLHERYETACTYEVIMLNTVTEEFEVRGEKGRKYLVSIEGRTCSCRMFDIDKIPCSHAIAALHKVGKANVPDLCSPYYTRETWRLAYQKTVYPVPDCCEWIIDNPNVANLVVMPPIMDEKRQSGRPKQNRYPGPGEAQKRIKCVAETSTSAMSERTTILE
ncbi:PREDICTED: uncharacterized protein LOC104821604 [Tarenaya hassleriana]|uniref:uncharacterized protein LOC104821604 n=1 Tax=Tarenaya hassleriana TaxID=28532 RepID=UPI00053C7CA5|nr:PREDICTED: uncharacterized protein LOC104821604 [Tarenaya hassleriana]